MIDKNTIYSYFQTDDFPTEEQFRATWDSFWHKSESIPMSSISGLNQLFQQTATVAQLNGKANVDGSNINVSAYQEKLNITNLIATAKEEVKTELLNGAPEAFDTLKEISDWISDDETAEAAILQAIQTEATARTEADNLKLNKPTTTSTTASYPFVVGENGNGGSARLPAGDLGKNFFNSDLSNTTARNHTMNAGVTVNTLGNPHTLSGLPNKNADIANFRKVRVQNTSGLDSVVDSKNLLTDGVTSMSDAEKDAWRIANLKTGENYSTGQPRVDLISPININNSYNYTQYVSVIGLNLYINTGASIVKLVRVKDENGVSITPEETLIDASSIQTFSTNFQILVLGINFFGKAKGYYKIYITSFTGLTNLTSPEFLVQENFSLSNFNPVSFSVVDKYANSSDYVTGSEIYHINLQQAGKATLEKSVKSNALFNFQNGFLYEFNLVMYLVGSYTNASFTCGFSNEDFAITNGYSPQALLGIGGDYGHRFINSVTSKEHNQQRNQTVVVKCIFFNKNGITTIIQLAPNGVVLVSSMVQNYNTGDPIRFYANFYSSDSAYGTTTGQNFKIQFPSTYQSF